MARVIIQGLMDSSSSPTARAIQLIDRLGQHGLDTRGFLSDLLTTDNLLDDTVLGLDEDHQMILEQC